MRVNNNVNTPNFRCIVRHGTWGIYQTPFKNSVMKIGFKK